MPDSSAAAQAADAEVVEKDDTVSTHVLVTEEDVRRLRALSRRTRIAQSEYLREAVDDLLRKYDAAPKEE
jgi:predicted DNA-binding protein